MADESPGAPAEQLPARPPPADLVVTQAAPRQATGTPPLTIFLAMMAVLLVSFGAAAFVLGGAGRVASSPSSSTSTPAPTATLAPGRMAGATQATSAVAAGGVRVLSTSGRSRPLASGTQHEVTFSWTLEGARENDQAVIQFYAGTRPLGQQRGTLDPTVFNFSTGTLTLTVAMECSTSGWTADLLSIRGQPILGDGEATVAAVQCR